MGIDVDITDRREFLRYVVAAALSSSVAPFMISSRSEKPAPELKLATQPPKPRPLDRGLAPAYARAQLNDMILQNASRLFPASRPYLEDIARANYDAMKIFDVPLEYFLGLLQKESEFNPDAVSKAYAMGIAQFMRPAALDRGLFTYDIGRHPALHNTELALNVLGSEASSLYNAAMSALRRNDFDAVKKNKLAYDKAHESYLKKFEECGKILEETLAGYDDLSGFDDRFDPGRAIPASARHLAIQCRENKDYFHSRWGHAIMYGIVAYNAGLLQAQKWHGIPILAEPVNYLRMIMIYADRLTPEEQMPLSDMLFKGPIQQLPPLGINYQYTMAADSSGMKG